MIILFLIRIVIFCHAELQNVMPNLFRHPQRDSETSSERQLSINYYSYYRTNNYEKSALLTKLIIRFKISLDALPKQKDC